MTSTYPLSPPETKCWSSSIATTSTLPSTNSLPLPLPALPAPPFCASVRLPSLLLIPARKTSCTSSSTFHHRHVRSRAPEVTAMVGLMDATALMASWWPKKVSMRERVEMEWRQRERAAEAETNWCEGLLSAGSAMA